MAKKKFNFKKIGQDAGKDFMNLGLIAGGMIGSKKFLSFDQLLSNQPPNSFIRENEGWIKAGSAVIAMPMVKDPMLKFLIMGVGLEGLITGIRKLTINQQTGQAYFPPIGNRSNQPAAVRQELNAGVGRPIKNRNYTPVGRALKPKGFRLGSPSNQPAAVRQELNAGVGRTPSTIPAGRTQSRPGMDMGVAGCYMH